MFSTEIQFVFQLGVLIVLTRMGGYWLRRWLRLPGVLGELLIGIAIGPYALGQFHWPVIGRLFPISASGAPVSAEDVEFPCRVEAKLEHIIHAIRRLLVRLR